MFQASNEKGNTLVLVLAVMAVGALLLMGALRLSDNQTLQVFGFLNREDALKHAELGYNKYLWELNQDSTFYLDSSRFIKTLDNNAKSVYQPIAQPNEDNYLVEIEIPKELLDSTYVPVSNRVTIRSTGWTNREPDKKRTLQVGLVKRSFAQYCMITDSDLTSEGEKIVWTSGEKCYGPLHTNGTLYIDGSPGPVFYGPVTYGVAINPSSKAKDKSIFKAGQAKTTPLNWPSSNSVLMKAARIGGLGHYYNGRTCIMLHDDGYDVRRWVSTEIIGNQTIDTWEYNGHLYQFEKTTNADLYQDKGNFYFPSKAARDGKPSFTSFSEIRSAYRSLSYPSNGVIYVNGGTNPDYTNATSKCDPTLGNVFISGQMEGQLTIGCSNDIFITAYDPTDWRNPWKNGDSTVFKSFTKTGGVRYRSSSTDFKPVKIGGVWDHTEVTGSNRDDMLGLVADNNIFILHYSWPAQIKLKETITEKSGNKTYTYGADGGWTNGSTDFPKDRDDNPGPDSAPNNILIHGALFTTKGSYGYEKPDLGPEKGKITLVGSIAQRNRGVVGRVSSSGYDKDYTHDPRMLYTSPPHYIEPTNTGWQVGEWKEISTQVTKASD